MREISLVRFWRGAGLRVTARPTLQAPFSPAPPPSACGVSEAAASACHDTMLGAKAPVYSLAA